MEDLDNERSVHEQNNEFVGSCGRDLTAPQRELSLAGITLTGSRSLTDPVSVPLPTHKQEVRLISWSGYTQ